MNSYTICQQQWAKIHLYMLAGVEMVGSKSFLLPINNLHKSVAAAEFEFNADTFEGAKLEFIVDVSLEGRHSSSVVKQTME